MPTIILALTYSNTDQDIEEGVILDIKNICHLTKDEKILITDKDIDFSMKKFILNNVSDLEEIYQYLYKFNKENLFFYCTLHGKERSFLLPNKELFPIETFFNKIFEIWNDKEKIILFDCCYSFNFFLPYEYNNNEWIIRKDFINWKHKNLILISSESEVNFVSNLSGSKLTNNFIKLVIEKTFDRNIKFFSSTIYPFLLPDWFLSNVRFG